MESVSKKDYRKLFIYFQEHVRNTTQKMKFSIKDFFSKCDEIRSFGFGHID